MRKISDTIARLSRLQAQRGHTVSAHGANDRLLPFAPAGSNPGALKAKVHVPEGLRAGSPLVVVLHGCTQTASGYDHHSGWSRLADEAGFALLYPEQQRANNPNLCFNWFQPSDARRGSGEALSIHQMIETMIEAHDLDRGRVFVTGLSAGGAMAATMLAAYPETFAAGAIIAGLPHGSASTIPEAFDRMRGHGGPSEKALQALLSEASGHDGPWPKVSIWQGLADQTVAPSNAEAIAAQWLEAHGLDRAPGVASTFGVVARQVWRNADGEPVLEINRIAGMGHGTPVGAGLGTPGPYMLDAGVSSTREIARFWGIAEASDMSGDMPSRPVANENAPAASRPAGALVVPGSGTRNSDAGNTSAGAQGSPDGVPNVRQVIEDALKAAGLMR